MEKVKHISCLYIDFDAFFANVEKQLHPEIRSRPVGVTSLASDNATLITCCYMAKAAGIKRGMRVYEARDICSDIAIQPARHDVYVDMHNRICAEVGRHVPVTKVWSIDEVECTLIGRERTASEDLAHRVRDGLAEAIGPYITPSIGLAPNQFLAKVAAEMNKPNGLTVLHPDALPGPLLGLRLKDLPGISTGMLKRLEAVGIISMADFWQISGKQARAIWGSVEGERLWAQLHGYAVSRPATTRRMFGHSRLLSGDWQSPEKANDCLRLLTQKAAYRMRREGYTAGSMSVSFRGKSPGQRWSGDTQFPACSDDRSLTQHMQGLYDAGLARSRLRYGRSFRLQNVYVMLHNIVPIGERTGDLFDDATTPQAANDAPKWGALTRTMDHLNERHGKCVIHLGPRAQLPGGYAGAKIAFGRVPDMKDFY